MSTLWQKTSREKDPLVESFTVGEDYLLDLNLVPYDIYASLAHAYMLTHIKILSHTEYTQIRNCLATALTEHKANRFIIHKEQEDVHTALEHMLTQTLGDTGKKIHTGRSRNDQVLTDLRLYTKDTLFTIKLQITELTQSILQFAQDHEFMPFPGYTHMQLAMPSSLGMWAGAFVEALLDELQLLDAIATLNDQSPLGSGAGYGTSLPLDRELTQKLLGFKRLQNNALYCSNSRGKLEATIISALVSVSLVLNKAASDVLLFTTKEFHFFTVSEALTTGSSIMPQKKNLDILELVRAKTALLLGFEASAKHLISHLISGYHRDFQESKGLLIKSFQTLAPCLEIMKLLFNKLTVNTDNILNAHHPELYATDKAYQLVMQGIPFRQAYQQVAQEITAIPNINPHATLKNKTSPGSTGNLMLHSHTESLKHIKKSTQQEQHNFHANLEALWTIN